jgi:hypothetical protein
MSAAQYFEGDHMGYVFIAFTENSRELALHVRGQLEAVRISTWLGDSHLENEADRALSRTALQAASALLIVSQKISGEAMSEITKLQHELAKGSPAGTPALILTDKQEFNVLVERLQQIPALQSGGSPLPISMSGEPFDRLYKPETEIQSPQNQLLIVFIVVALGVIVFIGMLMLSQMPNEPLKIERTSQTVTLSATELESVRELTSTPR